MGVTRLAYSLRACKVTDASYECPIRNGYSDNDRDGRVFLMAFPQLAVSYAGGYGHGSGFFSICGWDGSDDSTEFWWNYTWFSSTAGSSIADNGPDRTSTAGFGASF